MHHSLWNDKSLSGRKLDGAVFKVNQQSTVYNIKKLVVLIVLMPVILSLHDPEADHRVIYLAESLVVPRKLARVRKSLFVDYLQGFVQNV
jgi:hypothetical protein